MRKRFFVRLAALGMILSILAACGESAGREEGEYLLYFPVSRDVSYGAALKTQDWEGEGEPTPEKLMEATIELGMQNNEFLKAVVSNGRFDVLYQYTERNFRILDKKQGILPQNMLPVQREYVLSQLSMAMVAILITWTRNGRKESAAEVVQYLKSYAQLLQGLTGGK